MGRADFIRIFSFGTLLLLAGCAVDDRQLSPAGGATGPITSDPGDGSGGDGNPGPTGATPDRLVDGCADLDTDGVGDCTVTLVQNASFTSDVSGWTAGGDAAWVWDPLNALTDSPSGSGKLTVDTPRGSATQCVSVSSSNELIIAYVNVFVEPPDDGSMNQGDVSVSFFASADCSSAVLGSFDAPPSIVMGQWAVVQAGGLPTTAINSISVALTAVKSDTAALATVYFDNVMLKTKAL